MGQTIACEVRTSLVFFYLVSLYLFYAILICLHHWVCRWEKYQSEEEAVLGRGKRQRKAVSYREAYAPHPSETLSEVITIHMWFPKEHDLRLFNSTNHCTSDF